MEKYQQMIKLFMVLFICTAFIFSASYFGTQLIGSDKTAVNTASEGAKKTGENSKTETAASEPEAVINEASVQLDGTTDLQTLLAANSKIELPPKTVFSLLDLAKKQKLESMASDALSTIATGIYQAILPTNFIVEERNIGSELPSYAKLGFEAKVDPAANKDLAFLNPNQTTYVLELKQDGTNLIIDLKGDTLQYDYKISTEEAQQLQPKIITQYSPLLMAGQTKVTDPGRNGQTVEVFREAYQGSILVKSELLSNDYYPPDYRVVVQSLAVPNTTQPLSGTGTTTNSSTSQTNQDTQSATGAQTTTNSSDLWGVPNEGSK